jgi:hypothetical protein
VNSCFARTGALAPVRAKTQSFAMTSQYPGLSEDDSNRSLLMPRTSVECLQEGRL